jgi:hypothetical protein
MPRCRVCLRLLVFSRSCRFSAAPLLSFQFPLHFSSPHAAVIFTGVFLVVCRPFDVVQMPPVSLADGIQPSARRKRNGCMQQPLQR